MTQKTDKPKIARHIRECTCGDPTRGRHIFTCMTEEDFGETQLVKKTYEFNTLKPLATK